MFSWFSGSEEGRDQIKEESKKSKESKESKEKESAQAYLYHPFSGDTPLTPTLVQGSEFHKLQGKIKKSMKKKAKFITEGFGSMDTNSVVNQNQQISNRTLLNQMDRDLLNMSSMEAGVSMRAEKTVYRIHSNNPYLGKNVTFSTGEKAYVTNKGVLKLYPDQTTIQNTAGKNGCPPFDYNLIHLNIPWRSNYIFPGTILPTDPPIMTGSPMQTGQMCGNEDTNVFVTTTVSNPSSKYIGCYKDDINKHLMNSINNGSQTYTNESCLQAAIDGSYNYYALQNMNPSTGLSQCFVSNDLNRSQSLGVASQVCSRQKDGYMYGGASQNAVYKTPTSTFIGSYKDDSKRTMTAVNNGSRTYDYNSCYQEAVKTGSKYFGLQHFNKGNQLCQCFVSNDYQKSTSLGKSTSTSVGKDKKTYGGSWTNSIYEISTTPPYIGCYNDSTSKPAMTAVNNGSNKFNFTSCQQYAKNNGFSYFGLQDVQSKSYNPIFHLPDAMTSKCMVSNSLTETEKYGMAIPCTKGSDGSSYGNVGVNALYQTGQHGNVKDVGNLGYVDQDGVLSNYPSSLSTLSTTYQSIAQYDNSGNDIPKASYGNATNKMCQRTCNNLANCYGYVFDQSTSTCYPKNSDIYPKTARQPNPNRTLNLRKRVLTPGTAATNRSISNIDSVTWSNYVPSGESVSDRSPLNIGNFFGFSGYSPFRESFTVSKALASVNPNSLDPVKNNQLSQLEDRINLLSKQINTNTSKYGSSNEKINKESAALAADMQKYLDEYKKVQDELNHYATTNDSKVSTILKESQLVMTSQNYTYLLYAFLLVITAILTLKVVHRN